MAELPYGATISPDPVDAYSHLKEPFRSRWIQCITCGQVPTEMVYEIRIPAQVQGEKKSHALSAVCCSEECARKWVVTYEPHFHTHEEMEERTTAHTRAETWMDSLFPSNRLVS